MFNIEITGDTHPKRVTIVADEEGRTALRDRVSEAWGSDDKLAGALELAGACPDGRYRVRVEEQALEAFGELVKDEFPEPARRIETLLKDATATA